MSIFDRFWKWLGYHVCEEFTQWEKRAFVRTRAATRDERTWGNVQTVRFCVNYQERRCVICGKIQQRALKFGGVNNNAS